MLKLYHNAMSTCSQKVRFVLAEKELPYESHEIDLIAGGQHQDWYVKLNPKHVVPTIDHDGKILTESSLIIQYLDRISDRSPLSPSDPYAAYRMGKWIRLVDDEVHPAGSVVTFAIGPRTMLLRQSEEAREANLSAMPDVKKREQRRSVLEHGVKAPEFRSALGTFIKMLDLMEHDLAETRWLLGEQVTLADASVLAYVVRLDDLALDPLLDADTRPNVNRWYGDLRALSSFQEAVTKWTPGPVLEMFKANGRAVWADIESQL